MKPQHHRGDTLDGGTISTTFSSPISGVITVDVNHYKGLKERLPKFEVTSQPSQVITDQTPECSTLTTGNVKAVVSKVQNQFRVDFIENDTNKLLTQLGFRSLGYVKDLRKDVKMTGDAYEPFMTAQLQLSVREKVYGLGERFGPFVKNGQSVEVWQKDGGTSSEQAYKNVPFYLTNNGYGVFVDETSNVNFDIQGERTTRVNIVVPGESLKFHIIYGPSPKEILDKYTMLSGRPGLPPPWSFGLWLSTSFVTDYGEETVRSFLEGMKKRDIPLRTFHFDCFWMRGFQWCDFEFDPDFFPSNPKAILQGLKSDFGVNICVWLNPYIGQESKLFDLAYEKGYLIKKTNDDTWQTDSWQAGMGIVDFTNPEAYKWFQSELKRLMDYGVDAFKTDFGECIPVRGVKYFDGSDPIKMHNYFTFMYNKCVHEILEKERGQNQACLFARSATSGSQKFPVHWGGDCASTFEAMAESLRGGLSLTLSGFGFWSHDIGGFEGNPDPAVYKRWVAFGLLSSHSRLHGAGSYRVPWVFDDESSDVLRKFTKLKLSLMPYIYSAAVEAHQKGLSVMRAMLVEFPDDFIAWDADTQFMLGSNLLVAPVFEGSRGKVNYYIPEGKWYGYLDGKIRDGGKYVTETHDFMSVPLLVRENSVIITGADDSRPDYDWNEEFTINVFGVTSKVRVDIPDPKNLGQYCGNVTVSPSKEKEQGVQMIEVQVEGKVGTWSVKLLGASAVTQGSLGVEVQAADGLNNPIVMALAKGPGRMVVEYS